MRPPANHATASLRTRLWVFAAYCAGLVVLGLVLFFGNESSFVEILLVGLFASSLAAFVLGFSSIFTGVNFIATIHKMRAPGQGWFDLPLFLWALYATGIIQIFATLGFAVLYSTLVLYATRHLHSSAKEASAIMGVRATTFRGLGSFIGPKITEGRWIFRFAA